MLLHTTQSQALSEQLVVKGLQGNPLYCCVAAGQETSPSLPRSYVRLRKRLFLLKAAEASTYQAPDNTDLITQTSRLIYTALLSRSDSLLVEACCPPGMHGAGCGGHGSRARSRNQLLFISAPAMHAPSHSYSCGGFPFLRKAEVPSGDVMYRRGRCHQCEWSPPYPLRLLLPPR